MGEQDSVVFLVDDDPSFRRSCERLLSMAGYRVESFPSAQQFLQRGPPPDIPACLVTDLRMPGMNGLELQSVLASCRLGNSTHLRYRPRRRPHFGSRHESGCYRVSYEALSGA